MTGLSLIERFIVFAVIGALCGFIALTAMTSAFWFRLDSLEIEDACEGQPVPVEYHRAFVRDFHGEWLVSLWRLEDGEWQAWRATSGVWDYKLNLAPKPDRDLDWLVGGDPATAAPPPGMYKVDVAITANPRTIFSRSETITSNPFEVRSCTS